jgi:hypothetical protein
MIYERRGRESQSVHVGVGVGGAGGRWNGGVTREWNVERRNNLPIGSLVAQYTYTYPLTPGGHVFVNTAWRGAASAPARAGRAEGACARGRACARGLAAHAR